MEVQAITKNIRVSPQKLKLLVDQIKKKDPQEAVRVLDFVPNKSALFVQKTIKSALANAKNNHGLEQNSMKFKEIVIGKGVAFKRFRAGARGRARPIIKRTANLRIVLVTEEQVKPVKKLEKKGKNGTKS